MPADMVVEIRAQPERLKHWRVCRHHPRAMLGAEVIELGQKLRGLVCESLDGATLD